MPNPALIVHGGAWDIPDAEVADHREALSAALAAGRDRLRAGAAALDAVVAVIEVLEDHPALDAGVGAVLNRTGGIQLDAGVMDGATRDFGALLCTRRVRHPIAAAAHLLRRGHRQCSVLAGADADAWAAGEGLDTVEPETFILPRERLRFETLREREQRFHTSEAFRGPRGPRAPQGTVGCVALDRGGRLAAGTSTGGAPYTLPGRVGDSPLPGCGYYASPRAGASATGWGEAIARVLMCGDAIARIEAGAAPQAAAEAAVARLASLVHDPEGHGATGGIILLDGDGRCGMAFNTPRMARGTWCEGEEIGVWC